MNDTVGRLLAERQAMDSGFSKGMIAAAIMHGGFLLLVIAASLLKPAEPLLRVADGRLIPMPPGGGGVPTTEAPAPLAPTVAPQPSAPPVVAPTAAPKVLKPPRDEPPSRKGLPDPNAKGKPSRTPPPAPASQAGGVAGGTGTSPLTPGVLLGPVGPGVPGGTDWSGDWYMAGVQRKVWMIWNQMIRADPLRSPVTVEFTILADGSTQGVRLVEGSGVYLVDRAAQSAVLAAAPFAPLPKDRGSRITYRATFKPVS